MILETMKNLSFDLAHKIGDEFVGACPWCGGDDRFHVWVLSNLFWCRGCRRKGDEIQFLRELKDMSYIEACEYLGQEPKAATGHYRAPQSDKWQPKEAKPVKEIWSQKAGGLLSHFETQLLQNKPVLQWLHDDRGLSDEIIKTARLGWNQKDIYFDRQAWGLEPAINEKTGKQKSVWIPSGLVIPYIVDAQVIRLRIRRENPGAGDRYILVSGSDTRPMIFNTTHKTFAIFESELDAQLMHQVAGDQVNVIAMGSAQARPDASLDRLLHGAGVILNSLDSDEAGAKEAWKFWHKNYYQVKRWPCIRGKDPGEMFKVGVNLRKWILKGLPVAGPIRPVDDPPQPKEKTVIDFNDERIRYLKTDVSIDPLSVRLAELICMAENSRGLSDDQVRAISDEGDLIIDQLPPETVRAIFQIK